MADGNGAGEAFEPPAREAMEFDVVVVGAGPAGLAAAIRLKQLKPDLSVVVLEKSSEVGAHILSGVVMDPVGLDALLPEWRSAEDRPLKLEVTDDRFYYLGPAGGMRLPNALMPKLMSNHGNFVGSLANVARFLGRQAEALGVDIYPGFAAVEVLYGEAGEVVGVASGDMGVGRDGAITEAYTRGMELRAKYVLVAEGARGSLAKGLIRRFKLDEGRDPQKYGIGLKELWEVPAATHRPGLVQPSFGWPLGNRTGGGSFLYGMEDNLVSVGFVVHLNYENPTLSPFDEFQRFKTHPMIADTFAGGRRVAYGARAITEGGWQSVPKLSFPGGALVGCAAGFVNVPRIKGSHNAILSGMMAADHVARALDAGRQNDELASYEEAWRGSAIGTDLRRVKNVKPLWSRFGTLPGVGLGAPRHVGEPALRRLALRHSVARQAGLRDVEAVGGGQAHPLPAARRRAQLRQGLVGLSLGHQPRGEPTGSSRADRPFDPRGQELACLRRTRPALLSCRCLRGRLRRRGEETRPALRHQCTELRALQNLRHQGSVAEHHLGTARGRWRPDLSEHVRCANPLPVRARECRRGAPTLEGQVSADVRPFPGVSAGAAAGMIRVPSAGVMGVTRAAPHRAS